jgi:hypothetical protein
MNMYPHGVLPAPREPSPSLTERFVDSFCEWRNGLIGSPRFRRWAAAFPLTRPIAQRRASGLFDLVAGFVYSQVLLACVRLRLFDMLAEGPQTLSALAPRLGLSEDAALRLLAAAVSLKLVARRSRGRYGLGPLGAPMVGDAAIASMVEHHTTLYADLRDPVALLQGKAEGAGEWSTYHIVWRGGDSKFTGETFRVDSPKKDLKEGVRGGFSIDRRAATPDAIGCFLMLNGYRGTCEYTLTMFPHRGDNFQVCGGVLCD